MGDGKFLIFDAGPIISLTMNGLLDVLEKLKKEFKGEFIITPQVKEEVIDRPMKIKKYELEGVKVKNLLDRGILKISSDFIANSKLNKEIIKIMNSANSAFKAEDKLGLIHDGEASCMAFSRLCGGDSVIAIDERTSRMITEAPEKLRELMQKKLHTNVIINEKSLKELGKFKFIRSAELLYIAYKKNLFDLKKDKTLLDAVLYGVKFKGAAISSREINEIKSLD